jgi:hypothetical protein
MQSIVRVMLGAALAASLGAAALGLTAHAQTTAATIKDPEGPVPDPAHVPFVLPKDITWTGTYGVQQVAILYGNPNQPGPYTVLYRWFPGHFSQPHFHDQPRWAYVISGTWWVSSSNVYDERTTYPLHAGTYTQDIANTVHWDGARTGEQEPAVIILSGIGPVKTIQVDKDGKPKAGQ